MARPSSGQAGALGEPARFSTASITASGITASFAPQSLRHESPPVLHGRPRGECPELYRRTFLCPAIHEDHQANGVEAQVQKVVVVLDLLRVHLDGCSYIGAQPFPAERS